MRLKCLRYETVSDPAQPGVEVVGDFLFSGIGMLVSGVRFVTDPLVGVTVILPEDLSFPNEYDRALFHIQACRAAEELQVARGGKAVDA
jgi:hypothetical protein